MKSSRPEGVRSRAPWAKGALLLGLTALMLFTFVSTVSALIYVDDSDWFWQNPVPQGLDLNDVCFVDSSRGWAVGAEGTILVTTDGGATWSSQTSGTDEYLQAVSFADGLHGWAVSPYTADGTGVTLARTDDGGATWNVEPVALPLGVRDFCFVDATHGWMVGAVWDDQTGETTGAVYATVDGGATWVEQDPGYGGELNAVHFVDSLHGWAVGEQANWDTYSRSGAILATADGGATWTTQLALEATQEDEDLALHGVHFVDGARGWAVGAQGSILATVDGGAHWSPQTSPSSSRLGSVFFADAAHGWAVSATDILSTSDGGLNWTVHSTGLSDDNWLRSVASPDTSHACAVGGWGTMLFTSDGGATWTSPSTASSEWLFGVDFVDPAIGCVVGENGTLLTTADGGATWIPRDAGTHVDLLDVALVDRSFGWATGYSGGYDEALDEYVYTSVILATTDGGVTWGTQWTAQQPTWSVGMMRGIAFIDRLHGWAVGSGGVIMNTTDGGATWAVQESGTGIRFMDVAFVDTTHGWAVGRDYDSSEGVILATDDGGATWVTQRRSADELLMAVRFLDQSRGWASGQQGGWPGTGVILATTDGGQTWSTRLSGLDTSGNGGNGVTDLGFSDALNGWAVAGEWGAILRTDDGGATWGAEVVRTGTQLLGLDVVDGADAWAVGSRGSIIAMTPGFEPPPVEDTTPPVTSDDYDGLWHNTSLTVTLTAVDEQGGSGMVGELAKTEYSLDLGLTWVEGNSVFFPVGENGEGSGVHTLRYRSTDAAGNVETVNNVDVLIDARPPSTTDDAPLGPATGRVIVHFTAEDDLTGVTACSGVAATWYSVNGGAWSQGDEVALRPGSGVTQTVAYYSVDLAGNVEDTNSCTVRFLRKGGPPTSAALVAVAGVSTPARGLLR